MFPKKHRLTVPEFFHNPHSAARIASGLCFLSQKQTKKQDIRLTIVVPKSLDKRATKRHQTRRIMIEAIRTHLSVLKPVDVMIRMKRILAKNEQSAVFDEIKELFQKAGLFG